MRSVRVKKHVFFCDECETWYDRDVVITTCSCGAPLRELKENDVSEFYWKLRKSGYKIIPRDE